MGKPDFDLVRTVTTKPIAPCKASEIGCGTGDRAIWLAHPGFQVVGVDASDIAIERPAKKLPTQMPHLLLSCFDVKRGGTPPGPWCNCTPVTAGPTRSGWSRKTWFRASLRSKACSGCAWTARE